MHPSSIWAEVKSAVGFSINFLLLRYMNMSVQC